MFCETIWIERLKMSIYFGRFDLEMSDLSKILVQKPLKFRDCFLPGYCITLQLSVNLRGTVFKNMRKRRILREFFDLLESSDTFSSIVLVLMSL